MIVARKLTREFLLMQRVWAALGVTGMTQSDGIDGARTFVVHPPALSTRTSVTRPVVGTQPQSIADQDSGVRARVVGQRVRQVDLHSRAIAPGVLRRSVKRVLSAIVSREHDGDSLWLFCLTLTQDKVPESATTGQLSVPPNEPLLNSVRVRCRPGRAAGGLLEDNEHAVRLASAATVVSQSPCFRLTGFG